MNVLLTGLLLAEGARSDQFVRGFREGNLYRLPLTSVLLLAVGGLAIAGVFYVAERFLRTHQPQPINSDRRLFHDLCRVHGLDRTGIRFLLRLAQREQLTQRTAVFLRPELFRRSDTLSASETATLERLRKALFGT